MVIKKEYNKQDPLDGRLRKVADKFRKEIDVADSKHVILGLIFSRSISDAFEEFRVKLNGSQGLFFHDAGEYGSYPKNEEMRGAQCRIR